MESTIFEMIEEIDQIVDALPPLTPNASPGIRGDRKKIGEELDGLAIKIKELSAPDRNRPHAPVSVHPYRRNMSSPLSSPSPEPSARSRTRESKSNSTSAAGSPAHSIRDPDNAPTRSAPGPPASPVSKPADTGGEPGPPAPVKVPVSKPADADGGDLTNVSAYIYPESCPLTLFSGREARLRACPAMPENHIQIKKPPLGLG